MVVFYWRSGDLSFCPGYSVPALNSGRPALEGKLSYWGVAYIYIFYGSWAIKTQQKVQIKNPPSSSVLGCQKPKSGKAGTAGFHLPSTKEPYLMSPLSRTDLNVWQESWILKISASTLMEYSVTAKENRMRLLPTGKMDLKIKYVRLLISGWWRTERIVMSSRLKC